MDIIIDMNLSPEWVPFFEKHGHKARHWTELGPPTAPDSAIMTHARNHRAIVFTHDLDFGTLLAQTNEAGPSVVQVRSDSTSVEMIGTTVIGALKQCDIELRAGALLIVESKKHRIRLLPLNPES